MGNQSSRWAITRPVSIHRHSSVHKILPKLVRMRSLHHIYIYKFLQERYFCGSISVCEICTCKNYQHVQQLCAAHKICMLSDILLAIPVGIPVSHDTASLLQVDVPAVNFMSVMIHLQPQSQNPQFGKRIFHLVSETKVNTKMCVQGPMP